MAGRRKVYEGWSLVENVVPGDVPGALEAMKLHVISVDESGEAKTRCPAHYDRLGRYDQHPSFSVNVNSGLFGCWSCGFKGKFVELVEYVQEIDRDEAVAWVRARGTIQRVFHTLAKNRQEVVDTTTQINEASLALMKPPPKWVLERRGLSSSACALYGVLWEPEQELWITPVRDVDGVLLGWQEKNKRYFRNVPQGLKKSKILFGLHIVPYGCPRAVIVESPLDAVKLRSAGVECAVSSYGSGVSDRQMELLLERTEHVVVFMDNDGPGRQARDTLMQRWKGRGMGVSFVDYRLLYPWWDDIEGLDPGDLGYPELVHLVDNSVPASIASITLSRNVRSLRANICS